MADGTTPNYSFTLPEVGASRNTWGTKLNQNWTDIDLDLLDLENTKADLASPTFTGTVTIPTVDLNGGNIDGTVIGASTAAAATVTDLTVNGNTILGDASGDTVTFNASTVSIPNNLDFASGRFVIGATDIATTGDITLASSGSSGTLALGNTLGNFYGTIFQDAATTGKVRYNSYAASGSAHGHQWEINGTAYVTLNSSGNLSTTGTIEINSNATDGGLKITGSGTSSTPSIRLNATDSGANTGGIAEIYANSPGSGQGELSINVRNGGTPFLALRCETSGHTRPGADNAYSCGTASNRWSVVYAATGTINTSDETLKTESGYVPGLEFVTKVNPFSYKWIIGKNNIVQEPDGFDKKGKPKFKTKIIPVAGKREHWGFKAQQIKSILDELGIDCAGWVVDEDGIQGLRYDQFIAPAYKAIQELKQENNDLRLRLEALEAKLK